MLVSPLEQASEVAVAFEYRRYRPEGQRGNPIGVCTDETCRPAAAELSGRIRVGTRDDEATHIGVRECEGCGFLMHAKRCTNPESERWEECQACGATEFTFPLQYSESLLQQ